MRDIVPNRTIFFVLGTRNKFTREVTTTREIFLRGGRNFLTGAGHVPLAVPVLLPSHPSSALIHKIS